VKQVNYSQDSAAAAAVVVAAATQIHIQHR